MRFFERLDLKRGECYPDAWIAVGRNSFNANICYIQFRIPLFTLQKSYDGYSDEFKYGWHTPIILFKVLLNGFSIRARIKFHSYFMDEEVLDVYNPYSLDHIVINKPPPVRYFKSDGSIEKDTAL